MKDNERAAIVFETDASESFLIGTKDELKTFALSILNQLEQPLDRINLCGVNTLNSSGHFLTEPLVDICITGFVVVENPNDRRTLIDRLQGVVGSEPIDWKNRI